MFVYVFFFFSSRRRHTRLTCDWSSDVCSSDLAGRTQPVNPPLHRGRRQPHLGADLGVRRARVVHERGDNPPVQLIKGHGQILPPPAASAAAPWPRRPTRSRVVTVSRTSSSE